MWKGVDTTLGREVAIKILPDAFSQDPDRLARFEREARLLASLNHPHIATVHGLHEAGGVRFLAMEMVAGEDLARAIARGPIAPEDAIDIARQVASALEAAHDHGVIHRDLKPANILITPEGRVKVLDFGLAKSFEAGSVPSDLSPTLSPTLTAVGTQAGVILGTAAYMAPEQARARPVDRRADIWALGCVLFEMLAGRRAFAGDTTTDLLAAVVKDDPEWGLIPAHTPRLVRDLVRRCLVKDPGNRLRDAGDARIDLAAALSDPIDAEPAVEARARPAFAHLIAALLAGAVLASAGWWLTGAWSARATAPRVTRLALPAPEGMYVTKTRISPDGQVVALRAVERPGQDGDARLLLRRLDEDRFREIPSSDGVEMIAFSPDGAWIAFVAPIARESSRRRLYKVAVAADAPPIAVTDWDPAWHIGSFYDIVWMPGGDILTMTMASPQAMVFLDPGSGAVRPLVPLEAGAAGDFIPQAALPDGDLIAVRATWDGGYRVDPVVIDTATGAVKELAEDGARAVLSSTGHLVFSRHDKLLAASLDPDGQALRSGPVSILGGLHADGYSFRAWFDLAQDGTLVYLPGVETGLKRRLYLVTAGEARPWSGDVLRFAAENFTNQIDVSADGRWVALTVMNEDGLFEIWGSEVARPSLRRLAGFPTLDCQQPRWSPDATKLYFSCAGGTNLGGLHLLDTTAPGEPRPIVPNTAGEAPLQPLSVSPDGDEILVLKGTTMGNEVIALSLSGDGPGSPRRLIHGKGMIRDAIYSPRGDRIAYITNESGRLEAVVRARRPDGTVGLPVPIAPGRYIHWGPRADGADHLYIVKESDVVERHAIDASLSPGPAVAVPFAEASLRDDVLAWDSLPDGSFLVAVKGDDETPPRQISVVTGFHAELNRLVGAAR